MGYEQLILSVVYSILIELYGYLKEQQFAVALLLQPGTLIRIL